MMTGLITGKGWQWVGEGSQDSATTGGLVAGCPALQGPPGHDPVSH